MVASAESVLFSYRDQVAGFAGYLAMDGRDNPIAAGGFRVQRGLRPEVVVQLAQTMTMKQRLLGLAVDGAKCGIDYDPGHPDKHLAMRRFLRFLRPHLLDRFSMGPDMGTSWTEIEALARAENIPSVKIAIARAQGLSEAEVLRRLRLLEVHVGGRTLGQRRAGHGLAHAALAAIGATDGVGLRISIQGFGTLGTAAAQSLHDAGARIVALTDEHGALIDDQGLDMPRLLASTAQDNAPPLPGTGGTGIFDTPVDVLVLAACENAMDVEQAAALPHCVQTVVVGANLGLPTEVENLLERRGITVVPDFVGGCGGPASMDALFGPATCPTPEKFLDRLGDTMRSVVRRMLDRAAMSGSTSRQAALALCTEPAARQRSTPYG